MAERKEIKVRLIRCTPNPEETIALGAKLCYSKSGIEDLEARISAKDQSAFISKLMSMGHESVLEHDSFTFGVEGVSRVLLAQLTRHRIASFSVQSQRYVSLAEGFGYVIPPRIRNLGAEAVREYESQMAKMQEWYVYWQEKLGKGEGSNEDARFVLPNACETHITLTMNARELLHFFSLRCCNRAQWEIRALAREMLKLCKQVSPVIFESAGPGCVSGPCPEGAKSCGKASEMRELYKHL